MKVGAEKQFVDFQVVDDDGEPVTGILAADMTDLTYSTGVGAIASISLYDRDIADEWQAGGLIELGDGYYRLGVPNDAWLHTGRFMLMGEEPGQHVIFTAIPIINPPQPILTSEPTGDIGPTDSYASTSDADLYFQTKLHVKAWTNADERKRAVSGIEATRMIDRLVYEGCKTDTTQAHEFPRNKDTEVPIAIKHAQFEIQLALLSGVDPDKEYQMLSLTSTGINGVRDTYDRSSLPEHIVAGIPSIAAWRLLKPYLRAARAVKLSRV